MNKIMTSLTLLAGIGLATLAPQAQARDNYRGHDDRNYSQNRYEHDERRAYRHDYRHGYRGAKHDVRGHRHSQRYCQYRGHDHYQRYSRQDDIRVIFRF